MVARKKSGGARKKSVAPEETGVIKKSHRGRIKVALCYPNAYRAAMANLGFHQVYHLFNASGDVVCERATFGRGSERPGTIESGAPIGAFDIIAFSISYEADLPNLAKMLHLAGIPLDPEKRADENAPLVMAGGVMAFINPEPLAPFADAVAVGEAEAIIPGFLSIYREYRKKSRDELLAALAQAPGLYMPGLYGTDYGGDGSIVGRRPVFSDVPERIKRAVCKDPSDDPARTRVFTDKAEFGNMALIELSRGCVHGCRFCAGSHVFRPPRWVKAEAVESALSEGFEHRRRAGLVAASATDHPEFARIRAWVRGQGRLHSVASLRLDRVNQELLGDIRSCGHKTLTVAPEAGTERLRNVINKPITDGRIARAMETVGASGLPRLKLYFQAGLPFETEADVEAVPPLIAMMRAFLAKGAGKRKWPGRIIVSINPFVPKPGTPFQWQAMEEESVLKKKLEFLRRSLKKMGGVTVSGTSVREARFQAAVARGDRRTGRGIAEAVIRDKSPATYLKKIKGTPSPDWYINRSRKRNEHLPWEFINHGVSASILWKEHQKAGSARLTPPCRPGKCELCDACKSS
jgi:radical SAM superfamily enzyme YgiQ (UPF0313 family)